MGVLQVLIDTLFRGMAKDLEPDKVIDLVDRTADGPEHALSILQRIERATRPSEGSNETD